MTAGDEQWLKDLTTNEHVADVALFLRKMRRALEAAHENAEILAGRGWPDDSRELVQRELQLLRNALDRSQSTVGRVAP
jgi:hypothetical protein